jgi:uncharacterized membrane protein
MSRRAPKHGARCLGAAFAVLISSAVSHAGAESEYDIEQLQPLPGLFPLTAVHDLDDAGRAVGRTWKEESVGVQNHHAVLWSAPSEPIDLGDNGRWSEARGISATGLIAGRHDVPAGMRGALWTPQGRQTLPPLPGQPASEAYDVDDAGVAVGVSLISSTDVTAVRWVNGVPSALPGANGTSWAVAVNGSGQAVGQRDAWPERHAMLWEGQTFTVLPDLGGDFAWATNVSEGGTICGGSFDASSQIVAVLWDAETLQITPLPGPGFGAYTRVRDVNDQGVAVGEVCLSIECEPGDSRALVWRDGAVHDLNTLIPPGSGWTLWSATAVNESGEIVCVGAQNGFVSPRGFKLTPRGATSVADAGRATASLALSPNPTRGEGEISWTSPARADVTLSLLDVRGRRLASRRLEALPAGTARATLASLAPPNLASGVYVLELRRGDGAVEAVRVTLVR